VNILLQAVMVCEYGL